MQLLALAFALALQAPNQFSALHPVLQCDGAKAAACFDKGFKDAGHMKDIGKPGRPFYKESAKSSMELVPLYLAAYVEGFRVKKAFLNDDQVKQQRKIFETAGPMDSIYVAGDASASPKQANKETDGKTVAYKLPGVRVVMKVGDKVYEPRQQPGDLLAEYKSYDYTETRTYTDEEKVSVKDEYGYSHEQAVVVPHTLSDRHHDQWLIAHYEGTFDLFNADGTPRITPADKEITFYLIIGLTQKQFKYKLSYFARLNNIEPGK